TGLVPICKMLVEDGRWINLSDTGLPRFRSLGGMYSAVAKRVFADPMEAGKVMGLAPFGRHSFPVDRFLDIDGDTIRFMDTIPAAFADDAFWPNDQQTNEDLARSVQEALEIALLHVARRLRQQTGMDRLCLAGGIALNGVANERLLAEAGFNRIFITP